MKLSLFDYRLPKKLIAQEPIRPRDHSRLLVFDRKGGQIIHDYFFNLDKYLRPGDVLVFNNSKVFPARLIGHKETGGRVEVFLLRRVRGSDWQALIGGRIRYSGQIISFSQDFKCRAVKKLENGVWLVKFNKTGKDHLSAINRIGQTPTPPYIKKKSRLADYQTVYAKRPGSVAAPTAGFHFSNRLLFKLKRRGVQFEQITLHVGLGTFQPVKVDDIKKHKMHAEYAEVDKNTLKRLKQAKKHKRRIIAVGTTSVRALESVMTGVDDFYSRGFKGWLDIFIYPGYKFKFVDAMITNFHLPKSSLLMLVSAFAGRNKILAVYKKAIKLKYRFYSFGDGMFLF